MYQEQFSHELEKRNKVLYTFSFGSFDLRAQLLLFRVTFYITHRGYRTRNIYCNKESNISGYKIIDVCYFEASVLP